MKTTLSYLLATGMLFFGCKNLSKEKQNDSETAQSNFFEGNIVDLSYDYSNETIYWVTAKKFKLDTVSVISEK